MAATPHTAPPLPPSSPLIHCPSRLPPTRSTTGVCACFASSPRCTTARQVRLCTISRGLWRSYVVLSAVARVFYRLCPTPAQPSATAASSRAPTHPPGAEHVPYPSMLRMRPATAYPAVVRHNTPLTVVTPRAIPSPGLRASLTAAVGLPPGLLDGPEPATREGRQLRRALEAALKAKVLLSRSSCL